MKLLDRLRRHEDDELVEETPPEPVYSVENPPAIREGARTYVAHGDNVWGNSITFRAVRSNEAAISGWLARAPFPQTGDKVLIAMQSGKWGVWVFGKVGRAQGVSDMFQGTAYGAFDYVEGDDAPKTKSCDEFITDMSPFSR